MVVEDRKSSFKLNLVLGIAFLLASAFYLVKAVRFPVLLIGLCLP
jgi:Na+(H+)/acetate symporter ActP